MRRLAIDFGTSNTVAALAVDAQAPRTVDFGPSSLLPSAVYGGPDGITVGRAAQRQARLEPSRFEPNPKRRIDDGEVLLGDQVFPVVDLIAAVLRTVAGEVRRQFGGEVADEVRLTHPAQWGSIRQNILLSAARNAGLGRSIDLIPEPVAAAAQFTQLPGRQLAPGQAVAIYDLGGGTFDVAVVGRTAGNFAVLAEGGLTDLGGLDLDQAILDLIGRSAAVADPARWQAILRPTDGGTRRAARGLAEDVRAAKETLSDYAQTEVALPDPFVDVHLTRAEFENLVRPNLMRSIETMDQTLRRAGVAPSSLSTNLLLGGIFLVGGSSRVPLVARLIQERFHLTPVALDQPETAVALGALAVPLAGRDLRTSAAAPASRTPVTPVRPLAQPGSPMPPGSPAPQYFPPVPQYLRSAGARRTQTTGLHPLGSGSIPQSGAPQPPWSGTAPRENRQKLLVGSVALAVVLVVALVLIIVKPFASSSVADPTTDPTTSPSSRVTNGTQARTGSSAAVSTPPLSTPESSQTSPASTKITTAVPTTLTSEERAFVGSGFDVLQCILPAAATGSDSTGPVNIEREAFCQLNNDPGGGTFYLIVVSVGSETDVVDYLDYLASVRVSGTTEEDHSYTLNGASGRVIAAAALPIEGTKYPAVMWSQGGQNFVGVLAASGSITLADLETLWNDNVGT
ncbi:actin-like ATPase involved in cell morphogenesis [Nakamurella sp. UYEF19]